MDDDTFCTYSAARSSSTERRQWVWEGMGMGGMAGPSLSIFFYFSTPRRHLNRRRFVQIQGRRASSSALISPFAAHRGPSPAIARWKGRLFCRGQSSGGRVVGVMGVVGVVRAVRGECGRSFVASPSGVER